MTLSEDRPLEIGIERLEVVHALAKALEVAHTKEDILYILERIRAELKEGVAELDLLSDERKEPT